MTTSTSSAKQRRRRLKGWVKSTKQKGVNRCKMEDCLQQQQKEVFYSLPELPKTKKDGNKTGEVSTKREGGSSNNR